MSHCYLLVAPKVTIYGMRRVLIFPAPAVRGTTIRARWKVVIGDSGTQTLVGAGQVERVLIQGRECHVEVTATASDAEVRAPDLIERGVGMVRRLGETEYQSLLKRLREPLRISSPYYPPVPVHRDVESILPRETASWQDYRACLAAHRLTLSGAIHDLQALGVLRARLEPHAYQMRTALNVLRDKRGIALLADEVGLGKTIEAGLILKEYIVRGMVRRCLIIAPASLVPQWQSEMLEKFGERFVSPDDACFRGYSAEPRLIVSYNQFVQHALEITPFFWDMVLADEAHFLARPSSRRRRAVARLRRRRMLLLTATPLSNYLTDLWSLIDLLHPGLLGTARQFRATYARDAQCRQLKPEAAERLRQTVARVMVRTRRADTGLSFVERRVETCAVEPTDAERALIEASTRYMREIAKAHSGQQQTLLTELLSLRQSITSSPQAAVASLEARMQKHPEHGGRLMELIAIARAVEGGSKERMLVQMLGRIPSEQAIIFTSRLETARRLRDVLGEAAGVYAGLGQMGITKQSRADLLRRFRSGDLRYLICTDAAAEGLNLQNCHVLVNFDLHWNPMRIEQRIGRVHRLGQTDPVRVINLVLADTIDMHVYEIVHQKIELFRQTVGGLETIVTDLQDSRGDLDKRVLALLLHSGDDRQVRSELEQIAAKLAERAERERLRQEFTRGVLDPV